MFILGDYLNNNYNLHIILEERKIILYNTMNSFFLIKWHKPERNMVTAIILQVPFFLECATNI